jgi:hypothetical protein
MAEAEHEFPAIELADHARTFGGFVTAFKLGVLLVAAVLINLAVIAFAASGVMQVIGGLMIVLAHGVAFADSRGSGSGVAGLVVAGLSLVLLVLATA